MTEIWDAFNYEDVIRATENQKLPECNRGSWYCPVATKEDAKNLDKRCRKRGIDRVYDLGAGTLKFSVEMDKRGYDVIAYESLESLVDFAADKLPEHSVQIQNKDYYADWDKIKDDKAAFVAIGKVNSVPGTPPNGLTIDGMGVKR